MSLKHRIDKVENLLGGSGFQKMYDHWIDLLELMYPNLSAEEIHSKAETLARGGFSVGDAVDLASNKTPTLPCFEKAKTDNGNLPPSQ
jgi:hypothetical protein